MVHPLHHEGFEWDEGNENHLAEARIQWWEVEEVFWNRPKYAKDRASEPGDYFMFGLTDTGRALTVVIIANDVTLRLRAITGWESDQSERTRYLK